MSDALSLPVDLSRLRRRPDVEDPSLQAWDATDEILLREALEDVAARGLTGADVVLVGERHGAMSAGLAAAGLRGLRVVQDRLVHERALDANLDLLGLPTAAVRHLRVEPASFVGARLVLWQLPRSLDAVSRMVSVMHTVASEALLLAGGRVKHLSLSMNASLAAGFGPVQPQLAERKSRILRVRRDPTLLPPPIPAARRVVDVGGERLHLVGIGEAFGAAALDPGTALLLRTVERLDLRPDAAGAGDAAVSPRVLDLGCGNGTIAAFAALRWPRATVLAADDSADAVASTAATLAETLGDAAERVQVARSDAADDLEAGSVDLVLLNPPFHQGGTVHTGIGVKLIRAAARVLRPGGTLLTVYNSPLRHRGRLERLVGPTEQLARDRTFTLTRSIRR